MLLECWVPYKCNIASTFIHNFHPKMQICSKHLKTNELMLKIFREKKKKQRFFWTHLDSIFQIKVSGDFRKTNIPPYQMRSLGFSWSQSNGKVGNNTEYLGSHSRIYWFSCCYTLKALNGVTKFSLKKKKKKHFHKSLQYI